ncbi:MAG: hypothetical protein K2M44_04875, partial [Clostridia bacterium]|nr:hypothetical protein [Clostridia bacterium]
SGSLPTIDIPEEYAGCLDNSAFNYTYTDEDGNTVSASEMVAGKKYNVKATLKAEYAGNFEFVDISGNVLPDATVSTSHEFDYTGGSGDGTTIGREELEKILDEYFARYNKLTFWQLIVSIVSTSILFVIVLLFTVLIKQVKGKNKDKSKQDRTDSVKSEDDGE